MKYACYSPIIRGKIAKQILKESKRKMTPKAQENAKKIIEMFEPMEKNNVHSKYKEVIYISHIFQDKQSNLKHIEDTVKYLTKLHPENLYVSPVNAFGFLYNYTTYQQGLDMTLWLLSKCDKMMVCCGQWNESTGCIAEINYCKKHNIPYEIVGNIV